ncbi:MAG: VWA domain-containing protein [Treponema sp.]|nr:VWA domain-containing protein [Treponema sp.]
MKRTILALILIICAGFIVYGQSSPIDLVLLLDTSSGMSSSYDNVNNYLTGAFLSEFLRVGDTFHLITFSGTSRLDVARRISGVGDVETIIGRILLQYPIESGQNIGSALTFAEQYLSTLPARSKKIILVSIGSNNTSTLVSEARGRLESRDATIDFIQVTAGQPLTNVPVSGRPPAGSGTTATTTEQDQTGTVTDTTSQQTDDTTTGDQQDSTSSDSTGATTNNQNQYTQGQLTETSDSQLSLPLIIGLILLILLLLGLIIFAATRKKGSNFNRAAGASAGAGRASQGEKFVDHSKDLAKYASSQNRRTTPYDDRPTAIDKNKPVVINPSGPLILNLFVDEQNTGIGKRNIHSLKSGYKLSVGGGKADDYLIFLVPLPGNLGEIRRNGSQLTFIPRKPKYFPDIGSNEVRDCINKTIRVVSDKNYEVRFRFEMYEDPLAVLNRMLMSVKIPG